MIEDNLIFIDNHIIVVNKWSGLLSQGDISNTPSLFSLVKDYIKVKYNKPGNVYIGLVHRLDKPVSGVMIFARTSKAAARLSESFKNRLTEKKYFAVVHGTMTTSERRLSQMISTSTNHMNRIQIFEMSKEQNDANQYPSNTAPAILDYEVLATHRNPMASQQNRHTENHITLDQSLVKITLETGRKHQIRAQLSHIGHPIVGDVKYGASPSFSSKDIALHSFLLSISHPISMQKVRLSSMIVL